MRKKQGLLIIMDGLGDRPDPVLGLSLMHI